MSSHSGRARTSTTTNKGANAEVVRGPDVAPELVKAASAELPPAHGCWQRGTAGGWEEGTELSQAGRGALEELQGRGRADEEGR